MTSLPINDLNRHNQPLRPLLDAAVAEVLASGWYILGRQVEAFEREFAAYCGTSECISVGNGTDALELAVRALAAPGERVVTVANAGGYALRAILAAGCVPAFVDIDPAAMLMDPGSLEGCLQAGAGAVIVTHLYGRMADMESLLRISGSRGVPVIEDCAQAHGASRLGRPAGSWGAVGCYSFYPTKNLGALGDGGALVTSTASLADRLRLLRQYGWTRKYVSSVPGGRNSRLDEMQAAILRAKLPLLDGWNARRRNIVVSYREGLDDLPLRLPEPDGPEFVAHLAVVRSPRREELREHLAGQGIGTDIHYPVADHRQPASCNQSWAQVQLPMTEQCCEQVLTLPCFPEMTGAEVLGVIHSVRSFYREKDKECSASPPQ